MDLTWLVSVRMSLPVKDLTETEMADVSDVARRCRIRLDGTDRIECVSEAVHKQSKKGAYGRGSRPTMRYASGRGGIVGGAGCGVNPKPKSTHKHTQIHTHKDTHQGTRQQTKKKKVFFSDKDTHTHTHKPVDSSE